MSLVLTQKWARKPRSIWLYTILFLFFSIYLVGCGSKKPIVEKSAALAGAERLEHRASSAYAKGDAIGAAKDFQAALSVYESLAMQDAAAGVQLSLARIDSDEGRAHEALARVKAVVGLGGVTSPHTRLLAHGRAAALYLQQKDIAAASDSLTKAEALCASTCEAVSALLSLRSQAALATNDAQAAKTYASQALPLAQNPNDKANALRNLAESNLVLNQASQAAAEAEQALQIDQTQGHSLRVIRDLNLLSSIYTQSGNSERSAHYAALSQAASAARKQLISR